MTARKILAALMIPACLMCAGCGGVNTNADTATSVSTVTDCASYNPVKNGYGECELKLHDGRHVTCVVMKGYSRAGLSCDWEHANGNGAK